MALPHCGGRHPGLEPSPGFPDRSFLDGWETPRCWGQFTGKPGKNSPSLGIRLLVLLLRGESYEVSLSGFASLRLRLVLRWLEVRLSSLLDARGPQVGTS